MLKTSEKFTSGSSVWGKIKSFSQMKNSTKLMVNVFCLFSVFNATTSCTDELVEETSDDSGSAEAVSVDKEKFGNAIILGKKLNNPYSLKNMQAAYDSLCRETGVATRSVDLLEPTHLYVRFLPKDSVDINRLIKEKLDFFCYPLDYDVEQWGDYYHDPSIPEDQPTWQYTRVPVGYDFPDVQYEILDTCFIPDDDDEVETRMAGNAFSLEDLEDAAYEHSGNGDMLVKDELRAKHSPSGRFMVYNDSTHNYEGVAGIAVRMGKFVKWFHVHTDGDGYYSTKSTFRTDPHYWIYFHNKKDFKIGTFSVFADARLHAMGKHSNKGYSHAFEKGSDMWAHCIVNNAAYYMHNTYKYYMPNNITYWIIDSDFSSAPMLNHGTADNLEDIAILVSGVFALSFITPDIFIGRNGKDYVKLYSNTVHETFHTMHFKNVGISYWNNYIRGIIKCRREFDSGFIYGKTETDTKYSGYIAVGETFAYAAEKYACDIVMPYATKALSDSPQRWFRPYTTWQLFKNKISPLEFLSCMDANVTSMDALAKRLNSKNSAIPLTLYK